MSNTIVGELLLSKVVNDNDVQSMLRYGVTREHFQTSIEQKAYDFIMEYSRQNDGNSPSYQSLLDKVPDFSYQASTDDSFSWLTGQLKKSKLQLAFATFFNSGEFNALWEEHVKDDDPQGFADSLINSIETIKQDNRVSGRTGHRLEDASEWYVEEYYDRKDGKTIKFWKSRFDGLNELLGGGYQGGNMYTWFARSGRGKSIITMVEALTAASHGANVLLWILEMPKYEWASRAFSFVTAQEKVKTHRIKGIDYIGGYSVQELTNGQLPIQDEQDFMKFIQEFNEHIEGSITIKAVDDEDFTKRTVGQLERDIIEVGADVVVVDPFYYMDYSKNTSKTAGGDASNTSKALRKLAGRTKVVLHVITQADEDSTEKQGDERELKLPSRAEVKKTKQVLEDASYLLAFDSCDGRFQLGIGKGRSGGEGERVEGIFLPSIGYIEESSQGDISQLFEGAELEF